MLKDYYKVLGVAPSSTYKEIRRAYIEAAKLLHPDINHDESAIKDFQEVLEAYQVLSEKDLREEYDQARKYGTGVSAISEFETKVMSIRKMTEFLTAIRYIKKLKFKYAVNGTGIGASAGAYIGNEAGGIVGAVIGGAIGGILGNLGGKVVGNYVESDEYKQIKQDINTRLLDYVNSQPISIQKAYAEMIALTWKPESQRGVVDFVMNRSSIEYEKDKRIILPQAMEHFSQVLMNNDLFVLVTEYLSEMKRSKDSKDRDLCNEIMNKHINAIFEENKVLIQENSIQRINNLKNEISNNQIAVTQLEESFWPKAIWTGIGIFVLDLIISLVFKRFAWFSFLITGVPFVLIAKHYYLPISEKIKIHQQRTMELATSLSQESDKFSKIFK